MSDSIRLAFQDQRITPSEAVSLIRTARTTYASKHGDPAAAATADRTTLINAVAETLAEAGAASPDLRPVAGTIVDTWRASLSIRQPGRAATLTFRADEIAFPANPAAPDAAAPLGMARLSAATQTLLREIALKDGHDGDLSVVDLAIASKDDLNRLMQSLKADGYDRQEQALVDVMLQLTRGGGTSGKTYARFTLNQRHVTSVNVAGLSGPVRGKWQAATPGDIRPSLFQANTTYRSPDAVTKTSYDFPAVASNSWLNAALSARAALQGAPFHFQPPDPYDLAEIRALATRLPREKVPAFIETYMTAYFAHSGANVDYGVHDGQDKVRNARSYQTGEPFFGSRLQLEQLPDGRRVIDCQGFARLSELLFNALVPQQESGRVFCKNLWIPGHKLSLIRDGGSVYVVDNNQVNRIPMPADELTRLQTLIATHEKTSQEPLQGAQDTHGKIDRAVLPTLYKYMEDNHPTLVAKDGVYWNEGRALIGD